MASASSWRGTENLALAVVLWARRACQALIIIRDLQQAPTLRHPP
jgi:hypothetical protein